MAANHKIAIVIPCYKVTKHIQAVLESIDQGIIHHVYTVDDCCPDKSGEFIEKISDPDFVTVLYNKVNKGVGGAMMTGYQRAIEDDMDIVVKLDGDGQMDPRLIEKFVYPILAGDADYTKGNRFYNLDMVTQMPKMRLFGNTCLSFLNKISSGYWTLFDPTNGYTAISVEALKNLPFHKISERYFFESDMLFRLNIIRAKVIDVPMDAKYEDEVSGLKIHKIFGEFLSKHLKNMFKRLFYNYFLRDLSIASLELVSGLALFLFGVFYGAYKWIDAASHHTLAPTGTIMLSALTIIIGIQLLLSFLSYDISSVPKQAGYKVKRNIHETVRKLVSGHK